MSYIYECDHCGLCCRRLTIEADPTDVLREPRIAKEGQLMDGHGQYDILDSVWCLTGGKACPFRKNGRCEIYATRPDACVRFMAGCARCQELRTAFGLTPLEPVTETDAIMRRLRSAAIELMNEESP